MDPTATSGPTPERRSPRSRPWTAGDRRPGRRLLGRGLRPRRPGRTRSTSADRADDGAGCRSRRSRCSRRPGRCRVGGYRLALLLPMLGTVGGASRPAAGRAGSAGRLGDGVLAGRRCSAVAAVRRSTSGRTRSASRPPMRRRCHAGCSTASTTGRPVAVGWSPAPLFGRGGPPARGGPSPPRRAAVAGIVAWPAVAGRAGPPPCGGGAWRVACWLTGRRRARSAGAGRSRAEPRPGTSGVGGSADRLDEAHDDHRSRRHGDERRRPAARLGVAPSWRGRQLAASAGRARARSPDPGRRRVGAGRGLAGRRARLRPRPARRLPAARSGRASCRRARRTALLAPSSPWSRSPLRVGVPVPRRRRPAVGRRATRSRRAVLLGVLGRERAARAPALRRRRASPSAGGAGGPRRALARRALASVDDRSTPSRGRRRRRGRPGTPSCSGRRERVACRSPWPRSTTALARGRDRRADAVRRRPARRRRAGTIASPPSASPRGCHVLEERSRRASPGSGGRDHRARA